MNLTTLWTAIKGAISKLSESFQDGSGSMSATRLAFLGTIGSVLGVWIYACIHAKAFLPFDNSSIYLVGVLMTGKIAQNVTENQADALVTGKPATS